jgi:deoxyribonuclease-4
LILGAHCSIAGGFPEAAKAGRWIGCDAIQIFSRSPRMLAHTKPITPEAAKAWRESLAENRIESTMIHTNYLINLATPDKRMRKVARTAFVEEMERAQILGVRTLVFHPGAHMGKGATRGMKLVAESLDECIERADAPDVTPCIEIMAGGGSSVGHSFEQLRKVIDLSAHGDRLGVCIDTCHTFAAGYDIRTRDGYENVIARLDAVVGLDRVKAFHLNDSKGDVRSHLDRHENIGRGRLKKEAFRFLVNDARFADRPAVLETPGEDPAFKRNLKALRSLVAK